MSDAELDANNLPLEATLVPEGAEELKIRAGSPFRASGSADESNDAKESIEDQRPLVKGFSPLIGGAAEFEAGVASATACGGVIASLVMLPFAIVSAWLFPFGGLMIGVLGGLLGAFGLTSKRIAWASIAMATNISIAAFCYWKLI